MFEDLLQDFTEKNWTSSYKQYAFPKASNVNDRDSSSDFTYHDTTGELAKVLNIVTSDSNGLPKMLLLEIKTSREPENGFVFTSRQFELARIF
jgi:hypothetical protein